MHFISCHDGQIVTASAVGGSLTPQHDRGFRTGLDVLDYLLPDHSFARGAVHEILFSGGHPAAKFLALLLARAAGGVVVWCDRLRTLYPPAVVAAGISVEKLFLLRPPGQAEQSWAVAECMRCPGVGVTVAPVATLSRVEALRYHLAAERGGGVGLLLRPLDRNASVYAAATRWLVAPAPGLRTVQRWSVQLIHAHGGRVGETVILEHHRETNTVRAAEQLADRQAATTPQPVRASA